MKETCNLAEVNTHRSHRDGHFYMRPPRCPFVLHDLEGCVLIGEEEFRRLLDSGLIALSQSKNGEKINVRNGIAALAGYQRCPAARSCPKANFRGQYA